MAYQGNSKQYALGAELGYLVQQNIWAKVGYNFTGFTDQDLTGRDYTMQGLYVRMRIKFDEKDIEKRTSMFSSSRQQARQGEGY